MLGAKFQPLDIMLGRNPLMGIFFSTVYFMVQAHLKNETDIIENSSHLLSSLKTEKGLSLVFAFFVLWFKHEKDGWANFSRLFHARVKYEKTVELTLDSFSRSGSNMKRKVELIFRFHTLDPKMKTIPSVFYVATMLVKIVSEATSSFISSPHTRKRMEWRERSLIFSRSLNLEHYRSLLKGSSTQITFHLVRNG